MATIKYHELEEKTDEKIKEVFLNILTKNQIYYIQQIRNELLEIANGAPSDVPYWYSNSFENMLTQFSELFLLSNDRSKVIEPLYLFEGLMYESPSIYNEQGRFYSIPFLKAYNDLEGLKASSGKTDDLDKSILKKVNSTIEKYNLASITDKTAKLNEKSEATLALLDKHVGKIGVQLYADIFDRQALEHSNFFKSKGMEDTVPLKRGMGKAQVWVAVSILFTGILVWLFGKLDVWFPLVETLASKNGVKLLVNATSYTPTILVHLLSRVVSISICIFFISFSIKQYRINMHLYTLNKHRANTLKSFDYLTKAPDKLEPASYNAILMKVAESIYDAGQTGYISGSDTNHDMPSIIDMTKIINPSGK